VFCRQVIAFPFAAALFSLDETLVIFRVQLTDQFLDMVETSKRTPPAKRPNTWPSDCTRRSPASFSRRALAATNRGRCIPTSKSSPPLLFCCRRCDRLCNWRADRCFGLHIV